VVEVHLVRVGSTDEADLDALVTACVAEVSDSRPVAAAGRPLTTIMLPSWTDSRATAGGGRTTPPAASPPDGATGAEIA
jgi:hypothetical protein